MTRPPPLTSSCSVASCWSVCFNKLSWYLRRRSAVNARCLLPAANAVLAPSLSASRTTSIWWIVGRGSSGGRTGESACGSTSMYGMDESRHRAWIVYYPPVSGTSSTYLAGASGCNAKGGAQGVGVNEGMKDG